MPLQQCRLAFLFFLAVILNNPNSRCAIDWGVTLQVVKSQNCIALPHPKPLAWGTPAADRQPAVDLGLAESRPEGLGGLRAVQRRGLRAGGPFHDEEPGAAELVTLR